MLRFPDHLESFREQIHPFVGRDILRKQRAPPIFLERAGEERTLPAKLQGLVVEVVHKFVDQRQRDQLNLIGRQRKLADKDVAAAVKATFGFRSKHAGPK